ncbi:MAG: phosphoribosylformylglycinamidine synthase subunit PurQ [Acidimicrobiia bacterium]|nr:phosphoribosylformylglycinamidine synthase subunit PurQ [Acidimicrobiia bacterium]
MRSVTAPPPAIPRHSSASPADRSRTAPDESPGDDYPPAGDCRSGGRHHPAGTRRPRLRRRRRGSRQSNHRGVFARARPGVRAVGGAGHVREDARQSRHGELRDRDPRLSIGIITFPGTNCERDVAYAFEALGADTEQVWHRETSLDGIDGVVLPGGFAHGDYLRTGAIARFSPVMAAVEKLAAEGRPVLGICNGFQVLCEAGLLPGGLIANRDLRFICRPVHVRVQSPDSILTRAARPGQVLTIPLNSYEGNYITGGDAVRVMLRYTDAAGTLSDAANPNGSEGAIAAVANTAGNVAGLMPHPERAIEDFMGSTDGRILLESFVASLEAVPA